MKKLLLVIFITLITASAGAQWQPVFDSPHRVYDITASGSRLFAAINFNGVYLSNDNGINWSPTSLISTVYCLASNGSVLLAGGNGIFLSTNNGLDWINIQVDGRFFTSLAFFGSTVYAGTSASHIYRSTNSGLTWTQTSFTSATPTALEISGNYVFAGTDPYGVYFTTNNGANWQQTPLNNRSVRDIVINGNYIFACTPSAGVFISTNNGSNWVQSSLTTGIQSLAISGSNVFGSNFSNSGNSKVYVSNNNGANWTERSEGLAGHDSFVLYVHNDYVFAGSKSDSSNKIFRRPINEVIGIELITTEIPDGFSLAQNYPNPFNPSTKIKFDISYSSFVKLVVYDMLGREVSSLVDEQLKAGTYEYEFNASELNSGVYFYKISTDNFSEIKKMILIK